MNEVTEKLICPVCKHEVRKQTAPTCYDENENQLDCSCCCSLFLPKKTNHCDRCPNC